MDDLLRLLNALSDESRLRILNLIVSTDEICVCDIEKTLHFSQTKVSRHLSILKNANLVTDRRQGLWILYSYAGDKLEATKPLLKGLKDIFSSHPIFQEDIRRLRLAMRYGRCATVRVVDPSRTSKATRVHSKQFIVSKTHL